MSIIENVSYRIREAFESEWPDDNWEEVSDGANTLYDLNLWRDDLTGDLRAALYHVKYDNEGKHTTDTSRYLSLDVYQQLLEV
jgi:hypothetical protein